MPTFSARSRIPVPASALFDWHARPGAFERLSPPWQTVRLLHAEGIQPGDRAVIRLGTPPASVRWVAEHSATSDACRDGTSVCQFRDTQVEGPFAAWTHTHRMIPAGPDTCYLDDEVDFELPLAPVSTRIGGRLAEAQLDRMFAYRHRVTREDLIRHAAADQTPRTVAITGASGLLGSSLAGLLLTGGHRVVRLVRSREEAARMNRSETERAVYWNVARGEIDLEALADAAPDAVVHLAGEPVYGLAFTADKKRRIWESRTKGTQLLARALAALPVRPHVLVSASASGIYGDRGATPITEADAPGTGFLADVCQAWEASTAEAEAAGIRTVHARIGLVLSPAGGMLSTLGPAVQAGLAAWPGSGQAFWPWIALDDLLYGFLHLLNDDDLAGPVNLAAPTPEPAKTVVRTLARVLHRPRGIGIPAGLVRALGGEVADELALKSVRMLPTRLQSAGFRFAYPDLATALRHLYGRLPMPDAAPAPALAPS